MKTMRKTKVEPIKWHFYKPADGTLTCMAPKCHAEASHFAHVELTPGGATICMLVCSGCAQLTGAEIVGG